ncbi:MAG: cell division protein [Burkholderiales bacterium]|nr:cell division protein [Burkholderiales bacterium]
MTDLQTSLIAIGSAIVVGVIVYNKWQEYKARKTVERAFATPTDDVLMQSDVSHGQSNARVEPSLHARAGDIPLSTSETAAANVADSMLAAGVEALRELPVDPLIDCVIPLSLETPVHGERLVPILQTLRHVGSKPVHFIGQSSDGHWESVVHRGAYVALQAGVQLASRSGALNELEYSELVMRLRQIADEINAEPDVPDMTHVMAQARALHHFVHEYDAKLSVNIQSNGAPWAINTLLAALERQGFDIRPDGYLMMPDGDGGILFTLSTNVTPAAESTSRLTLLLDVPSVAPLRDGFGAMVACARVLATRLDGTVVDDTNQPLTEHAIAEIAQQVNAFYSGMEASDIPAGASRALRLFN